MKGKEIQNGAGQVIRRQSGEKFCLWWKKMCFKPAAESGNRGAKAKGRRQRVPDSRSGKRERALA